MSCVPDAIWTCTRRGVLSPRYTVRAGPCPCKRSTTCAPERPARLEIIRASAEIWVRVSIVTLAVGRRPDPPFAFVSHPRSSPLSRLSLHSRARPPLFPPSASAASASCPRLPPNLAPSCEPSARRLRRPLAYCCCPSRGDGPGVASASSCKVSRLDVFNNTPPRPYFFPPSLSLTRPPQTL